MADLYNRRAYILITDLESGEIKRITDLRITFDIDKNTESNPNTAKISVYNMNKEHRGFVESANLKIKLFAGYIGFYNIEAELSLLFVGNVTRVMTEKNDTDYITTFECGDGEKNIKETKINITYNQKKTVHSAISEMVQNMGLPLNIKGIDIKASFLNPVTFSGPVKNHLDYLTSTYNVEWSIQDEEVVVRPSTLAANQIEIVVLNESTGLIGIPVRREIDLGKKSIGKTSIIIPKASKSKKKKTKKNKKQTKFNGLEFTSLLNPLIKPTATVQIDSLIDNEFPIQGLYVVKKANYSGDTYEGDWIVKCEAISAD